MDTAPDGVFHRARRFPDEIIQEIFTHKVFSLLVRKKLIGLPLVEKILRWPHTGFNVHSEVRTQNKKEAERVGKYMIKDPKAIDRIIAHLKLTFEAERPPPSHHVQKDLLMAAEESGKYF